VADTRISALTRLPEAGVSPTDLLPIADLSASETKAITAKDLLEGVVINMDAGSIPAAKINFGTGVPASNIQVSKGDVVLGRSSGAGFAEELACTAAGRALLEAGDAAGQRAALNLGSLALRSGSWVDGSNFSGTSSGTNTGDQTITLTGDVTGGGTGTFAATIAPGAVVEAKLAAGAVSTRALADDAVTAVKLADQSAGLVTTGAPTATGAFIGQTAFNQTTGVAYTYTTTGWQQNAGVQSVTLSEVSTPLTITQSGTTDRQLSIDLDDQSVGMVWAGPSSGTATAKPTFRRLVSADLPVATSSAAGAVLPGDGTSVDVNGKLGLKAATTTVLGGVMAPGPELVVSAGGAITHADSGVTAGSYSRVTVNAKGHVTAGASLTAADIPDLPASKITSGQLAATLLANKSITRDKLADYAIAYIQEAIPPTTGVPIGELWYQESTAGLHMWNGNSWMPISIGRLSQENLRYCGLINAATGLITGVTSFGTAASYKIGDALRTAADADTGVYFVVETAGNGVGVTPSISYDPGDWVLCSGHAAGWHRIDTLTSGGGGGGGGVARLNDLLDVTLTTPTVGQILVYSSSGQWVNTDVLSGGTF
jgi:hypothetical protein